MNTGPCRENAMKVTSADREEPPFGWTAPGRHWID